LLVAVAVVGSTVETLVLVEEELVDTELQLLVSHQVLVAQLNLL
jgi:hypothetical protein